MERAVGIDLGTTYSCVAVWQKHGAEVIPNDQGNRTTPSMVAFTEHQTLLGEAASHQVANNPSNTVFDVKRLIGRRIKDPEVQRDMTLWPFKVVTEDDTNPLVEIDQAGIKKRFSPQQISSMVLTKMKSTAESFLGSQVRSAVITVPAYFTDAQRNSTKEAALMAGITPLRIVNEPSAAAIAYGFRPDLNGGPILPNNPKNVLVFDLGGGTFDVSIMGMHGGKFDVKAVAGDMHLGGEDFDNKMLDFCVNLFNRKNKPTADIRTNPKSLRRLRAECERAKRSLSTAMETEIHIDNLFQEHDLVARITRARFEELNAELFHRCIEIIEGCLADAALTRNEIHEVVLVGGSTRIPKVQKMLSEFFEGKSLCRSLNPDEAVAVGAAILAGGLTNEATEVVVRDVLPASLGLSINGGEMSVLLKKNTPIPTQQERTYTTRFDRQTEVAFPVYEGEKGRVAENYLVGEFKLTGIPEAPAGVPDIKVLFRVDENGILTVTASDASGRVQSVMKVTKDRSFEPGKSVAGTMRKSGYENEKPKQSPAVVVPKGSPEKSTKNKGSRSCLGFLCGAE